MPKTINKTAKGKRIESRCTEELKELGFITWKVVHVRYQKLDLFGLFDVAAIHPETGELLFIQCTATRCDAETRNAIRAFKVPAAVRKEIWIWKDNRGWVKEYYT